MELRSYNVEYVYLHGVTVAIGDDIGVIKDFSTFEEDLKSMIDQIATDNGGRVPFNKCHIREDGEMWTPYLQIVKMLILMGKRIGKVEFESPLTEQTIIRIL